MTKPKKDRLIQMLKVNRVEVIDHNATGRGRVFVIKNDDITGKVEVALQDDGQTLKIFL